MLDLLTWPPAQQKFELIQETFPSWVDIVCFSKGDAFIEEGINSTVQARINLEKASAMSWSQWF